MLVRWLTTTPGWAGVLWGPYGQDQTAVLLLFIFGSRPSLPSSLLLSHNFQRLCIAMFSVDDMELRVLMHSGSRDDSGAEDGEGPSSTLDLRIAAVFIVFAAGMLGCLPPLFMKVSRSSHTAYRVAGGTCVRQGQHLLSALIL